jgi:Holliday junction resolvase
MTNYNRGRAFEYKVRDLFRESGYYVIRSAGSKGIADLVAIKNESGWSMNETCFIQCKKSGKLNGIEKKDMIDLCSKLAVTPILARYKEKKIELIELRENEEILYTVD